MLKKSNIFEVNLQEIIKFFDWFFLRNEIPQPGGRNLNKSIKSLLFDSFLAIFL